jgi:hypothetical protein
MQGPIESHLTAWRDRGLSLSVTPASFPQSVLGQAATPSFVPPGVDSPPTSGSQEVAGTCRVASQQQNGQPQQRVWVLCQGLPWPHCAPGHVASGAVVSLGVAASAQQTPHVCSLQGSSASPGGPWGWGDMALNAHTENSSTGGDKERAMSPKPQSALMGPSFTHHNTF